MKPPSSHLLCFPRAAGLGLAAALVLLAGCGRTAPGRYQGYIEGEFVYVAAPLGGTLTNLAVNRGDAVKTGQLLFELEHEAEAASVREAEERQSQARARLADAQKGRRPSEIASLAAQLQRAKANLELSQLDLRRREQLHAQNVIAPEELDAAKSRRDADQAQVDSLSADLDTARLGARTDEIAAAEADVQAAGAALVRARWSVTQKRQFAPTNAVVQDTLYLPGEFVPAGNPVVSLLPPGNVRVRFLSRSPSWC
jgi:HlyD family secretion protein